MPTSLALLSILLVAAAVPAIAIPILDVAGVPVQPGIDYYVHPAVLSDDGGGVTLSTLHDSDDCPKYISQEPDSLDLGIPVKLFPANNPPVDVVDVDDKFIIQFSEVPDCMNKAVWTLTGENLGREPMLTTGGDDPGRPPPTGSTNNLFMAVEEEALLGYTLAYCPCNLCGSVCEPVGRALVDRLGILHLNDTEFPVVFVKAGAESKKYVGKLAALRGR